MHLRDKLIIIILFVFGTMLFIPELFLSASDDLDTYDQADTVNWVEPIYPIYSVNTGDQKLLALTFDDGPDPRFTNQVLDILHEHQVPATFFVVGTNAKQYPEIVRREIREGHEVENHTFTHPNLSQCDRIQTEVEIRKASQEIKSLTNKEPHYFRPPKKLYSKHTLDIAAKNGYQTVLWSICVEHSKSITAANMAQRVINASAPGMIVLAHDGRLDRSKTVEALPIIIKAYQQNGYTFVTLEELFAAEVKQTKDNSDMIQ